MLTQERLKETLNFTCEIEEFWIDTGSLNGHAI